MKPIWNISGKFYGWISESGAFYNSKGIQRGTINDNILYDSSGLYVGEIIQDNFIGFNIDHRDWFGPSSICEGEILLEPLIENMGIEILGFENPSEI